MSAVRAARRACLCGAAVFAVLGVGLTVVPARAADGGGGGTQPPGANFASFGGIADAAGIFQTADRNTGLEATYQTIYGRLPDGLTEYGSQVLSARASVYYPGAAIVGLGTLLCTLAPGSPFCALPPYPLYAQADGGTPDASVVSPVPSNGTGAPVGIGAGNADAHADSVRGVSSNAVLANYDTPQGTGAVVHVGSIQAHTKQFIDGKGILQVQASANLTGIDILGGVVHIGSIAAMSTSAADGNKDPINKLDFHISGVTAEGMPATIGANGISINGSGQGKPVIDSLNNALQTALSGAGISIRTIGATKKSLLDKQCTGGEVDGLQVQANVKVDIPPNLPPAIEQQLGQFADTYFVNMVLGGACTDASAFTLPPAGADQGGVPAAVGGAASAGGSGGGLPAASGGALDQPVQGTMSGGLGLPSAVHRATPGRPSSARTRSVLVGLEAELRTHRVADGLTLLYLAFTLLFVGLCLGLRPLFPARLPSGR